MLGHGYTGKPDYDYELPRYIEHILGFMDAVGMARARMWLPDQHRAVTARSRYGESSRRPMSNPMRAWGRVHGRGNVRPANDEHGVDAIEPPDDGAPEPFQTTEVSTLRDGRSSAIS